MFDTTGEVSNQPQQNKEQTNIVLVWERWKFLL